MGRGGGGRSVARRVRDVARERFGYRRLRPGQREAIESVVGGRDTLAVMPTGSGKSAIYQIAGMLLPRAAVVVSPLLALHREQAQRIAGRDLGGAVQLNSGLRAAERRRALSVVAGCAVKFIFLGPEQFANASVLSAVRRARPSLVVVDEAHCISEWGHDFRPEYLRLGDVIDALGRPPVLALTATAGPLVRGEIVARLRLRDPRVVTREIDRPNIWLAALRFETEEEKVRALLPWLALQPAPGIVYAGTHRHVQELARALRGAGLRAGAYHGGMPAGPRARTQDAFAAGRLDVVVATNAFGMGVDKRDVRFVAHFDVPDSLDAYWQEVGRGGRDDRPAKAMLFYRPKDLHLRRFLASRELVDEDELRRVAERAAASGGVTTAGALSHAAGVSSRKVAAAVNELADAGLIARAAGSTVIVRRGGVAAAAVPEAARRKRRRRQQERSRLEMMRTYAELETCRRAFLLGYFGDPRIEPCGRCDNCDAGRGAPAPAPDRPFPIHSRIAHRRWGRGEVLRYEADTMLAVFDTVGYKTLAVPLVLKNGLVRPEPAEP